MYNRLDTKIARLEAQSARIDNFIKRGYVRENYKQLIILTNDWKREDGQGAERFYFCVFKGTAATEIEHKYCATIDHRDRVIQKHKDNHDSLAAYKAEQKEKNKGKKSDHAGAAAAIKEELTKAFPGIKFSCKSDSFSMGDSVHISWTDGATAAEIQAISGKYQYGHFNGMEDIYENTNHRDDIPQSKYVSESRTMSDQIKVLQPQLEELINAGFKGFNSYDDRPEHVLYRLFAKTSLPAGAIVTGIERFDDQEGNGIESHFRIVFSAPHQESKKEESKPQPVETIPGQVQIIEYGDKAIAVIGDTKPIKEQLKALGGKFNLRLSCGAGWIFPKTKLMEITSALSKGEQKKEELNTEIQKTIEFFKDSDVAIYGEIQQGTKEIESKYKQPDVQIFDNLADIEAAAKNGQMISLCNLSALMNKRAQR